MTVYIRKYFNSKRQLDFLFGNEYQPLIQEDLCMLRKYVSMWKKTAYLWRNMMHKRQIPYFQSRFSCKIFVSRSLYEQKISSLYLASLKVLHGKSLQVRNRLTYSNDRTVELQLLLSLCSIDSGSISTVRLRFFRMYGESNIYQGKSYFKRGILTQSKITSLYFKMWK